jgi:quercetin dioxygenase-like cupin family protein
MCKELDYLHGLTHSLKEAPNFAEFEKEIGVGWKDYKSRNGTMRGYTIHNCPEVAIAKVHMSKGSFLGAHNHGECMEILVVLDGEIGLQFEDKMIKLEKFDHIKIDRNTNHIAIAYQETWMLAVTIPKDYGFPE